MIQHDDPLIRRRALQLFHHKMAGGGEEEEAGEGRGERETHTQVQKRKKKLTRGEEHLILEMLPELFGLVGVGVGVGGG